jgi:hypothetical protein
MSKKSTLFVIIYSTIFLSSIFYDGFDMRIKRLQTSSHPSAVSWLC